jgi:CSLREA domain-containing protein
MLATIVQKKVVFATCAFLLLAICPKVSSANVIYVTTLDDTIGDPSGCSLRDAIYSSTFHTNVALSAYSLPTGQTLVLTKCTSGSGTDTIILPNGSNLVFEPGNHADDSANASGLVTLPLISSDIIIEGNGATLSLGCPGCDPSGHPQQRLFNVESAGRLTLRNLRVSGFAALGGGGGIGGGGGGMGAGGAIYVRGSLEVENCTFDDNFATGGNGGAKGSGDTPGGGGGGGASGNGGNAGDDDGESDNLAGLIEALTFEGVFLDGGGGGGGAVGAGISGESDFLAENFVPSGGGGSGGGTVTFGAESTPSISLNFLPGGFACGGNGGSGGVVNVVSEQIVWSGGPGGDAPCEGGGGGGGGKGFPDGNGDGGRGSYGGGGGGGAEGGGNGGNGGFGGGGGGGWAGLTNRVKGGDGGFGGGGGAAPNAEIIVTSQVGKGGMFAGHGSSFYGGGGAGLGGAIFIDGGSAGIRNSTFTNNHAIGGIGGGAGHDGPAEDGTGAGAAIFSVSGHLTVVNTTVSGNGSTGPGAGIAVTQTSADAPTSFILNDSIVFGNGPTSVKDCSITGFVIAVSGAGNLIGNNDNCPGVVVTGDPHLGPLQNNRGFTPTMAIGPASAAFNIADPGTSLPTDQRLTPRPEDGGFDIGAYEFCDVIRDPSCSASVFGQAEVLTIIVSPPAGGTTTPPPGGNPEPENTVAVVTAIPNPGFAFSGWLGNVTAPTNASTTVVMNQPQTITANFVVCNCPTDVSALITVTRGGYVFNLGTGRYAQTVTLTNNSAVTLTGTFSLVLDSLSANATLFNENGATGASFPPAGSPYINAPTATLAPGQSTSIVLQFTDPTKAAITYSTRVLAGPGPR